MRSNPFTAMAFNILEGGHGHGEDRWATIAALISEQAPDVLVLCEANGFELRGHNRLFELERRIQMRGALACARTGFHVAIFARAAAWVSAEGLDGFYHAALRVKLLFGNIPITVVGAHLCPFGPTNRLCEAEILATECKPDHDVLLMGDLNALSPGEDHEAPLAAMTPHRRARHQSPLYNTTRQEREADTNAIHVLREAGFVDVAAKFGNLAPTYPTALRSETNKPSLRIDYVMASPRLAARCEGLSVLGGPRVAEASDHAPLVATFSALG